MLKQLCAQIPLHDFLGNVICLLVPRAAFWVCPAAKEGLTLIRDGPTSGHISMTVQLFGQGSPCGNGSKPFHGINGRASW